MDPSPRLEVEALERLVQHCAWASARFTHEGHQSPIGTELSNECAGLLRGSCRTSRAYGAGERFTGVIRAPLEPQELVVGHSRSPGAMRRCASRARSSAADAA